MTKQISNLILLTILTTNVESKSNFNNSFITKFEYGKMLYNNPRGISCNKCHGIDARGKVVSRFNHIKNKKTYVCNIETKDITGITYSKFMEKLDPTIEMVKKKFKKEQICAKLTYRNSMPTYFLTKDELNSIYFYLTNKEKYE